MKKLKTLKDIKKVDAALSGPLTPENGEDYDYSKGEPKFHTEYKVNYTELHDIAKEWIKFYRKNRELHWQWLNNSLGDNPICKKPKGLRLDEPYGCCLNPDEYESRINLLKLLFDIEE